jgi:hypothetical protein
MPHCACMSPNASCCIAGYLRAGKTILYRTKQRSYNFTAGIRVHFQSKAYGLSGRWSYTEASSPTRKLTLVPFCHSSFHICYTQLSLVYLYIHRLKKRYISDCRTKGLFLKTFLSFCWSLSLNAWYESMMDRGYFSVSPFIWMLPVQNYGTEGTSLQFYWRNYIKSCQVNVIFACICSIYCEIYVKFNYKFVDFVIKG